MPIAAALPFIAAAATTAGAIGSLTRGGQGTRGNTAQGPNDVWPLRQSAMDYLLRGQSTPGSAFSNFLVPGLDSAGNPNGPYAQLSNLFAATRAKALGQAKESAGNITGSGYANLYGSSLASSLADEQAQLGRLAMTGSEDNQRALINLILGFGTGGVGVGTPTYTPGWGSQLTGLGGQIGQIASSLPASAPASPAGTTVAGSAGDPGYNSPTGVVANRYGPASDPLSTLKAMIQPSGYSGFFRNPAYGGAV